MRIIYLVAFITLLNTLGSAQDYFQQQVDYKMDVELFPSENNFSADAIIDYHNNSTTTLNNIFFHLWSNAYKNDATALAQQMLRQNNTKMHFAKTEDLGGYEDIEFMQDGEVLNYKIHDNQIDIIQLELLKPIAPGEKIQIQCKFKVKIPLFFSRMGRENNFFQMTQWYPKPAVLDKDGWHPMPYLDIGEFYSEFGNYEVNITTPKGFEVAATGLTTNTNNDLKDKVQYTFKAENVHDFAWVACDHFTTLTDELTLENGDVISLRVHRINEVETWDESLQYLKDAVAFYSKQVAPYPYPQATVVQSPGGTGGGMEYPMLTTIDLDNSARDVDHVIAHEVGHNWFYGILATNEREQAWMDEGMNSYFDHRYSDMKHGPGGFNGGLPKFINSGSDQSLLETATVWQCKRGRNQACNVHSNEFSTVNYGLSAYEIPALSFEYLKNYLGQELFSKCIRAYYDKWKFKHPSKDDLIEVFESTSGESLNWFFDGLLFQDGYLDYKMKKIDQFNDELNVHITNKGTVNIPIRVDMMKDSVWIDHVWIPAFKGDTVINLKNQSYDYLKINGEHAFIDVNPENNGKRLKGNIKSLLPDLKILSRLDHPDQRELYLMPFWGWNNYDKNYLGISIFNSTLPQKWFRFNANVAYSFSTNDVVGTLKLEKDFLLNSDRFRKLTVHLDAKRFNYEKFQNLEILNYNKIKPGVSLFFTPDLANRKESSLSYYFHYLNKEIIENYEEFGVLNQGNIFHELVYNYSKGHAINSYNLKVALLQHNYEVELEEIESFNFLKLTAEFQGKYKYHKSAKFHYRVFAGYFPMNTQRYKNSFNNTFTRGTLNLSYGAAADVTFDHYFFGRTSQSHWTEKQILYNEGGFKTPLIYNQGSLGKSNHAAVAINLKTDIPIPLFKVIPLKPYLDLGYYAAPENIVEEQLAWKLLYDAGLALEFLDGAIGIYLPLFQSKDIDLIYDAESSFMRRVSFQINIQKLKPWDFIDRFEM